MTYSHLSRFRCRSQPRLRIGDVLGFGLDQQLRHGEVVVEFLAQQAEKAARRLLGHAFAFQKIQANAKERVGLHRLRSARRSRKLLLLLYYWLMAWGVV